MIYSTIPTQVGAAKLRNASLLGQTVNITRIAFGDGNGAEYEPTGQETELKNQVYECPPNRIEEEPTAPSWIELEAVIPHNVGGWYLREVGCYDDAGDLIFIGNIPSSFKPSGEAGVIKDLVFEMVYDAVAADVVQIKIDPNAVIATRNFVEQSFSSIGLGVESPPLLNSFNDLNKASGSTYRTDASTEGTAPLPGVNGVVHYERWGGNDFIMYFWPATLASSVKYVRRWKKGPGFTAWEKSFNSENLKFASRSDSESGVNNEKVVTPLNVHQAFNQYGLGVKSPVLLDSFNSLDKPNNSIFKTDSSTSGDSPIPGLNCVVRYERWGDNDFIMYCWVASQPSSITWVRRWKIGYGFTPWQQGFSTENLTPYKSTTLFYNLNGVGDGTTIDWSSSGNGLDDFKVLRVSGFLNVGSYKHHVSVTLPVNIVKSITGVNDSLLVGNFTAKGTSNDDVRLTLVNITQSQATVGILAQNYTAAITCIEGISY